MTQSDERDGARAVFEVEVELDEQQVTQALEDHDVATPADFVEYVKEILYSAPGFDGIDGYAIDYVLEISEIEFPNEDWDVTEHDDPCQHCEKSRKFLHDAEACTETCVHCRHTHRY